MFLINDLPGHWQQYRDSLVMDGSLTLDHCLAHDLHGNVYPYIRQCILDSLSINRTRFSALTTLGINNLNASIAVDSNQFNSLDLAYDRGDLESSYNKYLGNLSMGVNHFSEVRISRDSFVSPNSLLKSEYNTIQGELSIMSVGFSQLTATFNIDSLNGGFLYRNTMDRFGVSRHPSRRFRIVFDHCYIDKTFYCSEVTAISSITFRQCTFGPNLHTLSVRADTVKFEDCPNMSTELTLDIRPVRNTCWIKLVNARIADRKFNYNPSYHLAFDSTSNKDDFASAYEYLLAKFKAEGKNDSYERVDIEYQQEKAIRGSRWDKVFNWLDDNWWNYGYSKLEVIKWTGWFILIFFVLNSLLWKQMQELYRIDQDHSFIDRNENPAHYFLQKYVRILLYTCYIFFSVKINLSRLKVTNLFLVFYFFLQFTLGLWCLFFIVNAILKIA
jgi:hypothetical protein